MIQIFLLNLLYPEQYKQIMFKKYIKQDIQPKITLPLEDILFIFKTDKHDPRELVIRTTCPSFKPRIAASTGCINNCS